MFGKLRKLTFVFLACAIAIPAGSAVAAEKATIRIGTQPGLATSTIIQQSKWLEQEGYDVKWISFNNAGSELRALASNSLDVMMSGAAPGIVLCTRYPGCKLVAAPITNGAQLIVSADSKIKRVQELKGKNIAYPGPGSQQYALLSTALHQAGMEPADVGLYKTAAPAMAAQLIQGKVSGFMAWTPFTSEPVRKNQGKVLLDAEKVFKEAGGKGQWISEGYFARRSFVQDNPKIMLDVAKNIVRASHLVRTDLQQAASIWNAATGLPKAAFTYAVSNHFANFPPSIVPNVEAVESMVSIMKKAGLIGKGIDVKKYSVGLVEMSYAQNAESKAND